MFLLFLFPTLALSYNSIWTWNNMNTIPQQRNYYNQPEIPSACSNGRTSDTYAFACPHMTLLSDDMILASRFDNLENDFLYAVAGSSTDDDCGKCYQVQLLDAERKWRNNFKQFVVQVINSGYDVMSGQLDIFMGGGGFGYFDACNVDCKSNYCQGGGCLDNMYDTPFSNWNQAEYNDPNVCYSGGIKWLDSKSPEALLHLCQGLVGYQDNLKNRITVDSCFRSNILLYHQNFISTNYLQVQCPQGLTLLTGLQRQDDYENPFPHMDNRLENHCQGNPSQGHVCVTTMQDCCKFSCAWSNKGNPVANWSRVDACKKDGTIWYYQEIKN